jgi:hypothetical protein
MIPQNKGVYMCLYNNMLFHVIPIHSKYASVCFFSHYACWTKSYLSFILLLYKFSIHLHFTALKSFPSFQLPPSFSLPLSTTVGFKRCSPSHFLTSRSSKKDPRHGLQRVHVENFHPWKCGEFMRISCRYKISIHFHVSEEIDVFLSN